MNITPEQLFAKAQELRMSSPELVAIGMLKEAGFTPEDARQAVASQVMFKTACSRLVDKGFDAEEAVKMVKAANIDVSSLSAPSEEEEMADLLEKAAAELQAAQTEIAELSEELTITKQAAEARADFQAELPDSVSRLASSGAFTNADLDALQSMPRGTLTKVASAIDTPWNMGKPAGVARAQTDPILEFCFGGN